MVNFRNFHNIKSLIIVFLILESILQKTWKRLRENFRKASNKRKNRPSGSGGREEPPTCAYYKQLTFLLKSIGNRPTVSNIPKKVITPLSPPLSPTVVSATQQEAEPVGDETCKDLVIYKEPPKKREKKRNYGSTSSSTVDELLVQSLKEDLCKPKELPLAKEPEGPDELFCKSLVPYFKNLSNRKNMMAKINVMQVILELSSNENEKNSHNNNEN